MPLTEEQWEEKAQPRDDIVTLVQGVLESRKPAAYSIEEIFEEAESGAESSDSSAWETAGALVGEESAERRYEMAFELLVYEGKAEKRTALVDGEEVDFYRAT